MSSCEMSDSVNNPAHYNQGSVETIDGIRAALGDGFAGYCRGNVLKYVWRCGLKGDGVEDLRKAATYLQWAIETMEGNCPVMPDSSDRKPIAIPSGWRELEPDEVPVLTDMHEWMRGWFFRNDDATHEYKWHSSRHIRKIEPANSSETPNSSIPDPGEGYRLLSKDPPDGLLDTDEGFFTNGRDGGLWLSVNYSGGDQLPSVYYRRKIEAAKEPEYREPTYADIANGPIEVEVCDDNTCEMNKDFWVKVMLYGILPLASGFPYLAGVDGDVAQWKHARIKVQTHIL